MLIGLQNVTFEFGARVIVEDATWHIQPNERIGLIGYNGTGKSTLLKLFVNQYAPSEGTVERSRDTTIGYLHQDLLSFDTNDSILQVAMSAFEKVLQLEKEIEVLGIELEKTGDEKTLLEYTDKLHEMELLGGYNVQHKTEEVLQGLGFSNADLNRPYKEFSGGWRMRVLLAKMILAKPDLLLLDEPTNHLDLPSIEWLEKYLQHYQGAVVIVSHDKFFLNRMVTKIVELYQRELHFYNGNYDFYEKEKAVRIEMQQKAYENQQDYIRQNERLVERFRAKASKAAMAQSIMKKLDKLERIEDVAIERPDLRINFRVDKVPGRVLVELDHLSKAFGENVILSDAKAEIERGDKIALIGANGKGKSTLLRIIADAESYTGNRKWGHNVEESFYAQHQLEALSLDNTILDEMRSCGSQMTDLELRALLGCFLFSGDDSDKKIRILSGGEKARVALAKTIVSKANFLMLDEPTNHLDMHSVDLLINALNRYEGTLILVSHDRHFISKAANKIWEIVDGKIKEFKGPYDEWVAWNERMRKNAGANKAEALPQKAKPVAAATVAPAAPPATGTPINKELKKEIQRQQKMFQQAEDALNKNKALMARLEKDLADPEIYSDKTRFLKAEQEYAAAARENGRLEKEYESVFTRLMELEEKQ
ncbi:ABC-F family ATP-binding cassette domain-containing protein [Niabella beijingensis]|uniref:ABC-F family ATP-binding cassette domain-containing protein n=1 Tax=Niabella beijingensis TaxID=2872700 RepID=UPI001CC18E76|nr:ABC-F family ATP-binding cassette domain-containing protein [Niabella beijingensis]MBZ4191910.1 ABC-F family ATP-binding cassette domain-containing protein [Niabella beijingensis]